ncbi:MAG TPA: carboxypeptidase-like regulatory domain-containing protein, partial [Thermoanaerobaculia bacterium]|nr:carboxypeptidase-like regulatory domain-containing protein [Thermoanaerobaculia bacterium]
MTRRLGFAFLFMAFSVLSPLLAQEKTGSIAGTIVDSSGGALPGVTVTVTSPALIGSRSAVTNEHGEYLIQLLPPGTYQVRTELSGFGPMVRPGIEVRVSQNAAVNFRMATAVITETTTVTAEAPVIDVRNTSRNYTVDANAVALIPLGTGQQYTDLWVMAPGVRDTLATAGGAGLPSINGANGT